MGVLSQGADEIANALFTGAAYTGDSTFPPAPEAAEVAPVEAATAETPAMDMAPAQSGWGEQAPMGLAEIGQSDNATIIDLQPQVSGEYKAMLESMAANMPSQSNDMDQGMDR